MTNNALIEPVSVENLLASKSFRRTDLAEMLARTRTLRCFEAIDESLMVLRQIMLAPTDPNAPKGEEEKIRILAAVNIARISTTLIERGYGKPRQRIEFEEISNEEESKIIEEVSEMQEQTKVIIDAIEWSRLPPDQWPEHVRRILLPSESVEIELPGKRR